MSAMKSAVVSSCPLQFPDKQKGAVHIRLTPQLKEALLHAHGTGQRISMCFGEGLSSNVSLTTLLIGTDIVTDTYLIFVISGVR